MSEITMYHVTDGKNVDSIMADGLQPSHDGLYLIETKEDARLLGDEYHLITDPVVLEVSVMECNVREGPGDAGEVDEYVKNGAVMPVDIKVVN